MLLVYIIAMSLFVIAVAVGLDVGSDIRAEKKLAILRRADIVWRRRVVIPLAVVYNPKTNRRRHRLTA
jgi:hypothetical protein